MAERFYLVEVESDNECHWFGVMALSSAEAIARVKGLTEFWKWHVQPDYKYNARSDFSTTPIYIYGDD